jgi:hypothetical protein
MKITIFIMELLLLGCNNGTHSYVKCQCSCGKIITIRTDVLATQKSCGHSARTMPEQITGKVDRTELSKIQLKPSKANKSGVVGVCWVESRKKWQANIRFQGKRITLGWFINKADAIKARKTAAAKYFGPIIKKYIKSADT